MTDFDLKQQLAAQRLRQYGDQAQFQAPQGQMVGRHYVAPNALQFLASGLRSIGGMQGKAQAEQELQQIGEQRTQASQKALAEFLRQSQGTPEQKTPFQAPAFDEQDAQMMSQQGMQNVTPAVPPNMQAAYSALLQSPDQGMQRMGMEGATKFAMDQAEQQRKLAEQQRILSLLQTMSPQQAIAAGVPPDMVKQYMESRNYGRDKVTFQDVGGEKVPVTEYGDRPQGVAPLQKTGNPFSDLLVRGQDGKLVPNAPLVGVKQGIAKAGAARTNVSVNMPDKKFYEGLGTAVSGQIEQGFNQAQSAVQTLNNANQIAQSLDKAIVGPLANQRIGLARVGEMLGVTGADTREVLSNTRNVIQGLARQELAAAGQMKGQGQITESEREILRRAEAGNIQDFSKGELQTFIGAIRKTARSRIATHERNFEKLKKDPQNDTVVDFLQIEVPQDVPFKGQAPARNVFNDADAILNQGRR